MEKLDLRLQNKWGMHAQIGFHFSELSQRFDSAIRVGHNGEWADAKDLMGVLSLCIGPGDSLSIEAEGRDARPALAALSRFLLVDSKVL